MALVTLVALVSLTLYTGSKPGKRERSVTRKLLHAFVLLAGLSALAAAKDLQNLGGDGVAIQGYDPVAFFTDSQPVKGNPQFQSDYHGAKYYFASTDHKAMFDKAPLAIRTSVRRLLRIRRKPGKDCPGQD